MKFNREFHPKDGNCFVLMPHGIVDEFDWDAHYREIISSAITEAGMIPIRADDIYSAQQQLIERTWKSIQEAEIIIADITGRDPNVMYELGLAHVIWKPVILLATEQSVIPNDLSQYPPVRYTTEGMGLVQLIRELKKALTAAHEEPKTEEATLTPLIGRRVERVPAKVLTVTKDFAIVQTDDGRKGILNSEDANWIFHHPDLTKSCKEDEKLHGAFVSDTKGESRYSLIAVQDNPWDKLEEQFPVGQEFTGTVFSTTRSGVFVRMDFGINGFIPASTISEHLERNDEIRVITLNIDEKSRNVELRFVRKLLQSSAGTPPQEDWNFFVGQQLDGKISSVNINRGYALVQLTENIIGLMHINDMLDSTKKKFEASELEIGEQVKVEVYRVDNFRRKLNLKDITE
ncbi:MAG: S1 RNA-binding domain-containing protein [Candidatus Electrothrix sp. AUS1_2]|nr:S1 RNA-binding domain-containing protein [Candidatus Electrothrix sp. AUS1_2]